MGWSNAPNRLFFRYCPTDCFPEYCLGMILHFLLFEKLSCHVLKKSAEEMLVWLPHEDLARLPSVRLKVSGSLVWSPSPVQHSFSFSFQFPNLINHVGRGRGRSMWCNLVSCKVTKLPSATTPCLHLAVILQWVLVGDAVLYLKGMKISHICGRPTRQTTYSLRLFRGKLGMMSA